MLLWNSKILTENNHSVPPACWSSTLPLFLCDCIQYIMRMAAAWTANEPVFRLLIEHSDKANYVILFQVFFFWKFSPQIWQIRWLNLCYVISSAKKESVKSWNRKNENAGWSWQYKVHQVSMGLHWLTNTSRNNNIWFICIFNMADIRSNIPDKTFFNL